MKKCRFLSLLILIAVLSHSDAFAQELLVDINTLPIIPMQLFGGNQEARVKAQTAFFIQSGVTARVDMVKNAINGQMSKTKDKVILFVDNNTPLNSRKILLVVGTSHAILVDKNFRLSVPSPWFRRTTHTFYWQPDRYQMDLSVQF